MSAKNPERRQNTKDFMRGFFLTLCVFLPLCLIVFLISPSSAKQDDIVSQSVNEPAEEVPVIVNATASYNLLWMVSDSATNNLLSVALVRFDVDHYRIVVCNLPNTTIMLDEKSPVDLFTLFAQRGALGVRNAVETTLTVPISGYVAMQTDDLAQMIDTLGDISFTLDKELVVTNLEGLITYSKPAGTSSFSGNDVVQLLVYGNYINEQRMWLHEKLWQAALQAYGDDNLPSKVSSLYSSMVDRIETDINAAGIYAFCRVVQTVCPATGAQVEIVRPSGSFQDIKFEFAQGADEQLWVYFSKKQAA